MSQKISWRTPDELTITQVEISKSETLYGSYAVVGTTSATSDGNPKTSSNTWVTTYTDPLGTRTDWYRVRFYDSTTTVWSEYSEPTTAEELLRLCSVDEVKREIDTVGRWSDDEIFDTITDVDDLIYIECGTPLQSALTDVTKIDSTIQDTYYVGEENVYRIDRVFYGTSSKTELYLDDEFKTNNKYGMIKILPYASSGVTLDETCELEIRYVPKIYNKLSLFRTCKRLLEKSDTTSGSKTSKELDVINSKLADVEKLLMHRVGVQLSSMVQSYDSVYGVNQKKVVQDPYRNKYLGANGW